MSASGPNLTLGKFLKISAPAANQSFTFLVSDGRFLGAGLMQARHAISNFKKITHKV